VCWERTAATAATEAETAGAEETEGETATAEEVAATAETAETAAVAVREAGRAAAAREEEAAVVEREAAEGRTDQPDAARSRRSPCRMCIYCASKCTHTHPQSYIAAAPSDPKHRKHRRRHDGHARHVCAWGGKRASHVVSGLRSTRGVAWGVEHAPERGSRPAVVALAVTPPAAAVLADEVLPYRRCRLQRQPARQRAAQPHHSPACVSPPTLLYGWPAVAHGGNHLTSGIVHCADRTNTPGRSEAERRQVPWKRLRPNRRQGARTGTFGWLGAWSMT
jgi:hypothetical protein